MLAAIDIVVSFGEARALDGCSLELREGRITGIIGPNGAGKSTLAAYCRLRRLAHHLEALTSFDWPLKQVASLLRPPVERR